MRSGKSQTAVFLLLVLVFSACNSNSLRTVQATPTISQTETATATPRQATATRYLKTATPILPTPSVDVGYYEGIIVITQYYTYLDAGLYEQAYRLFSASTQNARSLDDYVDMASDVFKTVEIESILPYFIAVEQQGGKAKLDPINKRRFAV